MEFVTEILEVDPLNPSHEKIQRAVEWILNEEVVAFPTETVYGLGADASNDAAIKKIYKAKNRPSDNPLIVHFSKLEILNNYVQSVPEIAYEIAEKLWPGPLTIVLQSNKTLSPLVTQGLDTIAVRIPAHQIALALIEQSEVPIAAPSANLSGRPSPTTSAHVYNDLNGIIPMILDGGSSTFGVESTVVNLTEETPVLLRPGGVTVEELRDLIPNLVIPEISEVEQPLSPGMKYTHYSPNKNLILLQNGYNLSVRKIEEMAKNENSNPLILCTNPIHQHKIDSILLGKTMFDVQVNFFASLRLLDDRENQIGIFEGVEGINEGYTIMNRVRKAADKIL